jgi:prepilin-type N-terminal cleavage/methylation domain-containing protein
MNKGFTLIEILVVVIILGVMAAIVIPQFSNQRKNGDEYLEMLEHLKCLSKKYVRMIYLKSQIFLYEENDVSGVEFNISPKHFGEFEKVSKCGTEYNGVWSIEEIIPGVCWFGVRQE